MLSKNQDRSLCYLWVFIITSMHIFAVVRFLGGRFACNNFIVVYTTKISRVVSAFNSKAFGGDSDAILWGYWFLS